MATGIWVREVKKNHTIGDTTAACAHEGWADALLEACRKLDIPRPLILPKHERDFEQFSLTRFLPEHFMESVPFDRLEIEFIDPDKKKSKVNEKYL